MSNPNIIKVTPNKAKDLVENVLRAKLVPMLAGSPGIGKSDIVRSVADTFGLEVIDLRLSQCDPVILNGLPSKAEAVYDSEGNLEKSEKISFLPMDFFPIQGDKLPKGKNGWLLFLDEINSAPQAVQAAAYKLVLDRMVGKHHLHDNVAIVAAGNLASDKAIVNKQGTAMQSRLVHLQLEVSVSDWMSWAVGAGIEGRVISFINWNKQMLHNFDPQHNDLTFPCPRTWEFVSKLIDGQPVTPADSLALIGGTVGLGAARDFISYCTLYKDLSSYADVVASPNSTPIPQGAGSRHAMTGMLINEFEEKDINAVMDYLDRMDFEYQMFALDTIVKRNPTLTANSRVLNWVKKNAKYLTL